MKHGSDREASERTESFRQAVCRNKPLVAARRYPAEGGICQSVMGMMRDSEGYQDGGIEV
jgi:hypothetical protein